MRFKSLKSLTLGKQKKEPDQNDEKFKAIASDRIANMEKRIHGRTKELEEKAQQIKGLSSESDISELNSDIPKGPHGPLSELTLENGVNEDDENTLAQVVEVNGSDDEDGEGIKLVEVSAATIVSQGNDEESQEDQSAEAGAPSSELPKKEAGAAREAPPAEASAAPSESPEKEEEVKLDDDSDSLNNLFDNEEEEENPLANLIKSLPDVSAQEIIDDLREIKGIIKEWQKK